MEKIQERNFKFFWVPVLCGVPAAFVSGILFALGVLLTVSVPPLAVVFFGMGALVIAAPIAFQLMYKVYFYYQLSLDVNAICEGDGIETKSYWFVLALNAATFGIYGKYWVYKIAQRLQANAPRYGFKMIIGGKEMLVLDLFSNGWISAWEFVRNMNRIAAVYNQTGLAETVGGVQ